MKYISYLSFLLIAFSLAFVGCEDAEYDTSYNNIYLSDANGSAKMKTVTMDNGANISVIVRLANKMEEDVVVELGLDEASLKNYNEVNGTEYAVLDADKFPKEHKVTIPAGEISAVYSLQIDDFATNGITYAIPLYIKNVLSNNVNQSEGMNSFIYVLSKPLKVSVPVMSPTWDDPSLGKTDASKKWNVSCETYTVEAWVRMDGFDINNQAIFRAISSNSNLYVRFGDANGPYNYLQVKAHGDGGTDTQRDWNPNVWYHIAIVYNGNELILYRNGERVGGKQIPKPKGGAMIFDGFEVVCSSSQYFVNECSESQLRLWNYARSQAEIKNNMYSEVNPKNPNLIALWPMDEGQGNVFKDVTGNGRDITCYGNLIQRWEHNVRFDGK